MKISINGDVINAASIIEISKVSGISLTGNTFAFTIRFASGYTKSFNSKDGEALNKLRNDILAVWAGDYVELLAVQVTG
jgi:hypothetical protein